MIHYFPQKYIHPSFQRLLGIYYGLYPKKPINYVPFGNRNFMIFEQPWITLMNITSCSDISWTHCIPMSTGFLSIYSCAIDGFGAISTWSSAGLSEKLHCRPNSDLFFVYTYCISILLCYALKNKVCFRKRNLMQCLTKTKTQIVIGHWHKHFFQSVQCLIKKLNIKKQEVTDYYIQKSMIQ